MVKEEELMDFNDKPKFKVAMDRMASHFGQELTLDQLEFYFEELKGYPLVLIEKGIKAALDLRDPNDKFLRRALLSVSEIRMGIETIEESTRENKRVGCQKCDWTGWITSKTEEGRVIASPCECLYQEAKKDLKRKKRIGSLDEIYDQYKRAIVKAYEVHQEKYGGLEEIQKPEEEEEPPF